MTVFRFSTVGIPSGKNCRTVNGRTAVKNPQLSCGNCKLREATMKTDGELRKDKDQGFIQTFAPAEMDSNFAVENALLVGMAPLTVHGDPDGITVPSALHRTHRLEPPSVAIVLSVNFTGDSPAAIIKN